MMQEPPCAVYEQLSNAPFTATGIRPGGLDLTRRALTRLKLPSGANILDIGCGTGVTVQFLHREYAFRAVGIDSSQVMPAQGKIRDASLPLLRGDAETLPFADAAFDCVILECTLSLVRDANRVLNECLRVLRPLGSVIVTDLYARNPDAIGALRQLPIQSCLRGAFDKDRLIRACSAVGFELVCFEDHSEKLRDFAAQIVWTYGSLDLFWTEMGGNCVDPAKIGSAVREARPGYFLYLGSKNGETEGTRGE